MTTRSSVTTYFFSAILIVATLPCLVLAQVELDNSSSTSTLPVPLIQDISATPWYQLEELSNATAFGDFVVGPGRIEVELRPGESAVYEISVSNRISNGRIFNLTTEDMVGSPDGSRSAILLGDERGPYSIQDYISFPENTFSINLGERARIPVTISIPVDAEPGGYYGSVLISTTRIDEEGEVTEGARSPIVARIGTLFFITVPGTVTTAGETKSISLPESKLWYEKGPVELSILYENTGSIHLNPYGELRITNTFGEEVGYVELEPWFVLPQSLRSRDVTWDRELLFGRYTATANINRGYDDVIDTVAVSFWVLPWKIMGGIFLIVFIIVFGTRAFFRQFEFKRRKS